MRSARRTIRWAARTGTGTGVAMQRIRWISRHRSIAAMRVSVAVRWSPVSPPARLRRVTSLRSNSAKAVSTSRRCNRVGWDLNASTERRIRSPSKRHSSAVSGGAGGGGGESQPLIATSTTAARTLHRIRHSTPGYRTVRSKGIWFKVRGRSLPALRWDP